MRTTNVTNKALTLFRSTPIGRSLLGRLRSARVQRLAKRAWKRIATRLPWLAGLAPTLVRQRQVIDVAHWESRSATPGPTTPKSEAEIGEHLRALRHDASWQARRRAVRELATTVTDDVTDALVSALRDPSAEVATAALSALGTRPSPRVAGVLRGVVDNADGFFASVTRAAATTALAAADDSAPSAETLSRAVHDVDAEVSLSAIAAIAAHRPDVAEAALMPILRDHSGFFLSLVRVAAVRALSEVGRLSAEASAELLTAETDPAVREALLASPSPQR